MKTKAVQLCHVIKLADGGANIATDSQQTIDPPGLFRSPRYANIVVAGGFAFIAGQTAFDAEGNVVGVGDIKAQCEKTLENLSIALRAVNAEPKDIVKVTNYATDRAYLAALVEVRNRVWGELRTASTAVVGGLARDSLMVEVDAIVYLGRDS